MPIDFTPIRLAARANGLGFQVVQADWSDSLSPIRLLDIDALDFRINWRNDNPLADTQLRRERFRPRLASPYTRTLFQRMFKEVDVKRDFLLSWLPKQESGLSIRKLSA